MLRIWIRIKKALQDPDPDEHMRIRIREVKKPRKCTSSLGECRNGRSKEMILKYLKLYVC